jgi:hypothetical protein
VKTAIICASAIGLFASSAAAMPLAQRPTIAPASVFSEVKIVCTQDGHCYHRGGRPVVRWIYGDGDFYGPGPYVGPGYYGNPPGRHTAWVPFWIY